jgi:hypothetical protein
VNDIDSGGDCFPKIFIIGSRAAVQGQNSPGSLTVVTGENNVWMVEHF